LLDHSAFDQYAGIGWRPLAGHSAQ
jgi:hypothetical protein